MKSFPWTGQFSNLEQVDEYHSGKRIVCLECGKSYRNLSMHIARGHGGDVFEYRRKFNIPRKYPLMVSDLQERISAKMKERNNKPILDKLREQAIRERKKVKSDPCQLSLHGNEHNFGRTGNAVKARKKFEEIRAKVEAAWRATARATP